MSRHLLVESQPSEPLTLSDEQAEWLDALGVDLASKADFWRDAGAGASLKRRRVIRIDREADGQCRITVDNAVGVVETNGLQLEVRPKIPLDHLLYLMERAKWIPRFVAREARLHPSERLIELIAHWYLGSLDTLLRSELLKDYIAVSNDIPILRGHLDALPSARHFYAGSLILSCRYEEFDVDTPLNRVLRAALRALLRNEVFSPEIRSRAQRVLLRFEDVSDVSSADLSVRTDRRTVRYEDALQLARLILRSESRALEIGLARGWVFFIGTPLVVEDGIRNILTQALSGICIVTKQKRFLAQSTLSVNPDLRFEPRLAVGDIKYKLYNYSWANSDLYQAVAFAAAARVSDAVVINFATSGGPQMPVANFGGICVQSVTWRCDTSIGPAEAADLVIRDIKAWLLRVLSQRPTEAIA